MARGGQGWRDLGCRRRCPGGGGGVGSAWADFERVKRSAQAGGGGVLLLAFVSFYYHRVVVFCAAAVTHPTPSSVSGVFAMVRRVRSAVRPGSFFCSGGSGVH